MKHFGLGVLVISCVLAGCSETNYIKAPVPEDGVEIGLKDKLDGILGGYCLDIAKGRENVNPENGLQAHTCYSYTGKLGTDQVFAPGRFSDNTLYMPAFEVCATVQSTSAGSAIGLASCSDDPNQKFSFAGDGTITPVAAPTLCLTASSETEPGGGSQHQKKKLTLETCSKDDATRQTWTTQQVNG